MVSKAMLTPSRRLKKGANKKGSDHTHTGPRKQKLQIDRDELLRVEANLVEKVSSRKSLAGFVYNCRKCKKTFKKRIRCLAHARNCGEANTAKKRKKSIRKLQCNICDQIAYTRAELSCHRQSEHKALLRQHRCTRCHNQFSSIKSYWRHVRRHSSNISYSCSYKGCEKKFSTQANVRRHMKQHQPAEVQQGVSTQSLTPFSPIHSLNTPLNTTSSLVQSISSSSSLERALPPNLQVRNQRIRENLAGYLEILRDQGDSPRQLEKVSRIALSKLYIPTPLGRRAPNSPHAGPSSALESPSPTVVDGGEAPNSPQAGPSFALPSSSPSAVDGGETPRTDPPASETVLKISIATQTEFKYRCDICLKDHRDNWKLKQHKQEMHQPRREGG